MRQSANALYVLHTIGIAHLDLKPENMVYKKDPIYGDHLLKIIDLGISYKCNTQTRLNNSTVNLTDKLGGLTAAYAPPEILRRAVDLSVKDVKFTLGKTDIYSWAMTFFTMLTGRNTIDLNTYSSTYKLVKEKYDSSYIEQIVKPGLNII